MFKKIFTIFLGVLVFFILLEIILRLLMFTYFFSIDRVNINKAEKSDEVRILCIGESTTAGFFDNSYPCMLENILEDKGIKAKVINKGIHKTNTNFILENIPQYLKEYSPNIVIAMMGINDDDVLYYSGIQEKNSSFFKYIKSYQYLRKLIDIVAFKAKFFNYKKPTVDNMLNEALYERMNNNFAKAEILYKHAQSLDKKNIKSYFLLADMYIDQKNMEKMKKVYEEIENLFPNDDRVYLYLANNLIRIANYKDAFFYAKKAKELNPNEVSINLIMANIYYYLGDLDSAERLYIDVLEKENFKKGSFEKEIYKGLALLYKDKKEYSKAKEYFKKAAKLSFHNDKMGLNILSYGTVFKDKVFEMTRSNYIKLFDLLKMHEIKLVVIPYPTRSIDVFKRIFNNENNVFLVDNANMFNEAIKQEGFSKIFIDAFAGDFGHCTIKGNELLAGSIADVIEKEILTKN